MIVYQRDGGAHLQVTNSGLIVPAEQIERLLEPFQRLDAERVAEPDGLGLGLSIVRAIADLHGASLTVRAQPAGGLDIHISFPPYGAHSDEKATTSTNTTAPSSRKAAPDTRRSRSGPNAGRSEFRSVGDNRGLYPRPSRSLHIALAGAGVPCAFSFLSR